MKILKIIFIFIIIGLLAGCKKDSDKISLVGRYYSNPESENKRLLPYVDLYDNYEFYIMDSVLTSGRIIGTYELVDNIVVLNSNRGRQFRFEMNEDTLIYIENENDQIEDIDDQTVFYRSSE